MLTNVIFKNIYKEMCQHLEGMYDLVSQYFLNGQSIYDVRKS